MTILSGLCSIHDVRDERVGNRRKESIINEAVMANRGLNESINPNFKIELPNLEIRTSTPTNK